jgi:hypothetical protein
MISPTMVAIAKAANNRAALAAPAPSGLSTGVKVGIGLAGVAALVLILRSRHGRR